MVFNVNESVEGIAKDFFFERAMIVWTEDNLVEENKINCEIEWIKKWEMTIKTK